MNKDLSINNLQQLIGRIREQMDGLWLPSILTLALVAYGLSNLPGHIIAAIVAILPIAWAWRQRMITKFTLTSGDLVNQKNKAISDSSTRINVLQDRVTEFKQQVKDLKHDALQQSNTVTQLRQKQNTLETDLKILTAKHSTLVAENQSLMQDHQTLKNDFNLSQQAIDNLIESSEDGVVICDKGRVIRHINAFLTTRIGRSAQELIGHTPASFLKEDALVAAMEEALSYKGASPALLPLRKIRDVSAISVRGIWQGNTPLGTAIIFHSDDPSKYEHRNSPFPRPRSTVSLDEVFNWFFEDDSYRPNVPYINLVAHKARNDPAYAGNMGAHGSSEPETGRALYSIIRLLKPSTVIEVGSYAGAASITMAQALVDAGDDDSRLHCVELSGDHIQIAKRNLTEAGLLDRVIFHHGPSDTPSIIRSLPKSKMIFVDGDHTYEGAKRDFETYVELLEQDGVMIYHDTIKIMALQILMDEIAHNPKFDIFTLATSDGDGITLIRKRTVQSET